MYSYATTFLQKTSLQISTFKKQYSKAKSLI